MNVLADYYDFFLFLGGIFAVGGIIYLSLRQNIKKIFISEEEIATLKTSDQATTFKISFPKISLATALLIIIVAGFLLNQILILKVSPNNTFPRININITKK